MAALDKKISKLLQKREKLDSRLNTLQQKAKVESRKLDARRKIVVGGAVIARMEKDPAFAASIRSLLLASVGRPKDRAAIADLVGETPAPSPAPSSEGGEDRGTVGGGG